MDTPAEIVPASSEETAETIDVVSVDQSADSADNVVADTAGSDAGSVSSDEWALEPNLIASKFGADSGEKASHTHCAPRIKALRLAS